MARGRPTEVFVRRLRPKEGRAIRRIVRRGKKDASPVTWRRALVVLMSAQRRTPAEIADATGAKRSWVRSVIHAFNETGVDALHPKWGGGRLRKITDDMGPRSSRPPRLPPQLVGEPYTHWSLSKLAAYLVKTKVVPEISKERLREILIEEGFSIQRTKTWKWSPDPDFERKQKRLEPRDDTAEHPVRVVERHAPHPTLAVPVIAEPVVVPTGFGETGPVVTRTRAAR